VALGPQKCIGDVYVCTRILIQTKQSCVQGSNGVLRSGVALSVRSVLPALPVESITAHFALSTLAALALTLNAWTILEGGQLNVAPLLT